MKITTEKNKNQLERMAGNALADMIRLREGRPLLLLLSGGSSFNFLQYVPAEIFDSSVTFGMLDDRYSMDPSVNSAMMLKTTEFCRAAEERGATLLDSSVFPDESLADYANRYEVGIINWITTHPEGLIRATVGIGPDGHTSGVLPFPENPQLFQTLFESDWLVVGYDVGNKNPHRYRLTSTFTLMRKFDAVLTYMSGEEKKDALERVLAEKGNLPETPGRIIRELNNVTIFTDIILR